MTIDIDKTLQKLLKLNREHKNLLNELKEVLDNKNTTDIVDLGGC